MSAFARTAHSFAFDLVVLGGGSGGVRASRIAASHGAKVALIEGAAQHGPPTYTALGGTCVNVGCIPKKLMHQAGLHGGNIEDAKSFGWEVGPTTHSW